MFLGIDVGSITTKAVLIDINSKKIASQVIRTGVSIRDAVNKIVESILQNGDLNFDDILNIVSTGYGRKKVSLASKAVTEITAHAKGVVAEFPSTSVVIDIGGQDTKVIRLNKDGNVDDFVMNDKCAAGTGRFLEVMANLLSIDISEFGNIALQSLGQLKLGSTCTVFAESEVISMIANEEKVGDIAYAIHTAVVGSIMHLARKVNLSGNITLSGGVSYNSAISKMIADKIGRIVNVSANPQIVGAYGAALMAEHLYRKNM